MRALRGGLAAIIVITFTGSAAADTILGCVEQNSGKLRIVGVPGQCKSNETPISWESEGPEGPEGPQGPQGDPAPAAPTFELVGFTSSTFDGDDGVFAFTLACQAEVVAGSRMCDSLEVMRTVNVPTLSGQAWVRPIQLGGSSTKDISGGSNASGDAKLACLGWQRNTAPGFSGLTVDLNGSFQVSTCSNFHPVACCAPVAP